MDTRTAAVKTIFFTRINLENETLFLRLLSVSLAQAGKIHDDFDLILLSRFFCLKIFDSR
jgi:hypothetical protein